MKLKACPFCGLIIHDPNGIEKTCECPNDMDHMSRALWNTRPIEDALRSENEKLQFELLQMTANAERERLNNERMKRALQEIEQLANRIIYKSDGIYPMNVNDILDKAEYALKGE